MSNGHFPCRCSEAQGFRAFESLNFRLVREREHISMLRENPDGSKSPLAMPNHPRIKSSTLRTICTQAGISREEFLQVYEKA